MARTSLLGHDTALFDPGAGEFDDLIQRRIWGLERTLESVGWAVEAVPGMNSLTVQFDPAATTPAEVAQALGSLWLAQQPIEPEGRVVEAPTIYGGECGPDLAELAERLRTSAEQAARAHAAVTYSVAAVGAMPGFVYLSGLHPDLAWPRLASPRPSTPAGAVIIGGAQTGIMPITAPTGWHSIGRTPLTLFDPARDEPALLRPGDRVRFTVVDVRP